MHCTHPSCAHRGTTTPLQPARAGPTVAGGTLTGSTPNDYARGLVRATGARIGVDDATAAGGAGRERGTLNIPRRARSVGLVTAAVAVAVIIAAVLVVARSQATDGRAADGIIPKSFSPASATIDNPYLPLGVGTQFVLEGTADRGPGVEAHRLTTSVTDLTKEVAGIRARVIYEVDSNAGRVEEAELALFAQDRGGSVWGVGEYPEEYEEGRLAGAPSTWVPGEDGALAGIAMQGSPKVGVPTYRQGLVESIEFGDVAKIVKDGQRVCIKLGCYDDVVVIDEWNTFEPKPHQLKYVAPGVGTILVEPVNDPESERLELVAVNRLSPEQLAAVRLEALELEKRAYATQKAYRATKAAVAG